MTTPNREPGRTIFPAATLQALYDSSGRRWFTLGAMLLIIMGCAVWTVRHDPLAISALFFAIAGILRTVPKIMEARKTMLHGASHPGPDDAAAAAAGSPPR
jgi:hypothetical protein